MRGRPVRDLGRGGRRVIYGLRGHGMQIEKVTIFTKEER
jgi:hypothetical protein